MATGSVSSQGECCLRQEGTCAHGHDVTTGLHGQTRSYYVGIISKIGDSTAVGAESCIRNSCAKVAGYREARERKATDLQGNVVCQAPAGKKFPCTEKRQAWSGARSSQLTADSEGAIETAIGLVSGDEAAFRRGRRRQYLSTRKHCQRSGRKPSRPREAPSPKTGVQLAVGQKTL